ncbi:cation:proton antiporter [Plectonema cf. radiosum LEGE 06105]|uniref:Cation:proton antiporter n=1 Tax=Plectonema cf. radiosum LEGE 06105 TaxID=945769 RepID=A0A8J7EZY3_9CYAN|nr:cation:proton antiporter [Plectonema radiosum]MBE9211875.1 cation:proton antiporter [Plectonema cf. radiosum LEGE 06105]
MVLLERIAVLPYSQVIEKEPIFPLFLILVVILVVPILFERLRLPGLIGLILSGILIGNFGWELFDINNSAWTLLSKIGLAYLLFVAGLEVDLNQFRRRRNRALGFGSFAFAIPLLLGTLLGRIFEFDWLSSILIGSILASYSLLAYPIINRLGLMNNEAVGVTIGASIFTDIAALLMLVICVAIHIKDFNPGQTIALLGWLIVYCVVVLIGFDWAGKEFLRRSGEDEGNQFLFVLLAVFIAAVGAQLIGIEIIVAAFFAGLAVNEVIGDGPVKQKIVFVGSLLFIPIFFVDLGFKLDLPMFIKNIGMLSFTLFLILSLIISKFIAALLAKLIYHYNWREIFTMWSISLPQVGITSCVTLIGYQAQLLPLEVLNSVIFLILVTSLIGPIITSRVAVGLHSSLIKQQETPANYDVSQKIGSPFSIIVPVYNPQTQQHLMEMAALLAHQTQGKIIPLAIATAAAHMDAPQLENSLKRSEILLNKATALSRILDVEAEPLLRIDDAFAQGISRAAKEKKANLIVMGWGKRTGLKARLFGNVIDGVLWASHCPVAVTRLVESPSKIQRILVPVENLTAPILQPVQFAQILALANQAQVTVLNVCDRRTSSSKISWRRSQLSLLISKLGLSNPPEIQIIAHENVAQAILQAARLYDLVVLPFIRNRTIPGGLAISDVTTQLASQLTCSIIMLGEPAQRTNNAAVTADVASNQLPVTSYQ